MDFLISIKEHYQDNKLFPEGDTVYFDPLFKRLREDNPIEFIRNKEGIESMRKSIERVKNNKKIKHGKILNEQFHPIDLG